MRVADIKIARPRQIRPCKICATASPLYGTVDFNKNCEARRGLLLPEANIPVGYNKCPRCGFLFTPAFDRWEREDYRRGIYNEDYILVDPDYKQERPLSNAAMLAKAFAADKSQLSVLDFGGGNGILAATLLKNGFQSAATYDPFNREFAKLPLRRFDIVTCFETLEHVPDPLRQIAEIARLVAEEGVVFFSTVVLPEDFDDIGLDWWYVGPRNGHISLFSRQALADAWATQGYRIASVDDDLHMAFRTIPAFARHLVPGLPPSLSGSGRAAGADRSAKEAPPSGEPIVPMTDGQTALPKKVEAPYQLVKAKHGLMLCNANDFYMGKALITYGECCETETQFLNQLAQHGGVVVEVGANMGIHSVPLARFLAAQGRKLVVFEPQPVIFEQLRANLALNGCTNVSAWPFACGAKRGILTFEAPDYRGFGNFGAVSMSAAGTQPGVRVPCVPLDEMMGDERVGLIKIDVEGFERKVLEGAAGTLRRCRPLLYVENDREDQSRDLIEWLWAAGYKLWWHLPFLFNPNNFLGVSENLYPGVVSLNMVGIPQEMPATVRDLKLVDDAGFHPVSVLHQPSSA